MKSGGEESGSVLVDALVAVGIMALTLAFAAEAVGDSARRTRSAENSRLATMEARSRLAEVGGDIPLQVGRDSGEDGDLVWQVDVQPVAGLAGKSGLLLDVKVDVSDRAGRPLAALHTLRFSGV